MDRGCACFATHAGLSGSKYQRVARYQDEKCTIDERRDLSLDPITLTGFLAAILTTFAFVPQVVRTLRTRDTHAISLWMYVLFTAGVFLWLVYGTMLALWPVVVANGVTFLLALSVLVLKLRDG